MKRHSLQRGMTLIELMVACAILAIIILAVGYIFTQTSGAVNLTQTTIDMNASIRASQGQFAEDVRAMTRDGFLAIVDGTKPDSQPTGTPPALIFTITGRFSSKTTTVGVNGPPVTANAAMVVYTPCLDTSGKSWALARYVFLLTGLQQPGAGSPAGYTPTIWPTLDQQVAPGNTLPNNIATGVSNPLVVSDCLGESLASITAGLSKYDKTLPSPQNTWLANQFGPILVNSYVAPIIQPNLSPTRFGQLNTAPDTTARVGYLWPYMIGNLARTTTIAGINYPSGVVFSFTDGKENIGTPVGTPRVWNTARSAYQYDQANLTTPGYVFRDNPPGLVLGGMVGVAPARAPAMICWTCNDKAAWPKALKITLGLQDAAKRVVEPKNYEIILDLPQ